MDKRKCRECGRELSDWQQEIPAAVICIPCCMATPAVQETMKALENQRSNDGGGT